MGDSVELRERDRGAWDSFAAPDPSYVEKVLAEITRRGPVTGGDFAEGPRKSGWWNWSRGVREEGEVRVVPLSARSLWMGLIAGAAGSVALGVLAKQLHAALPFLDAALTSFSLVASWLGARKHTANWTLWIVVDVIYIGEYLYKSLQATALLYAILVGLAVLGLRDWRRAEVRVDQIAA